MGESMTASPETATSEAQRKRQVAAGADATNGANQRRRVSGLWLAGEGTVAALSGVLLAAAFPPCEWGEVAWVALVPWLLIPRPRYWRRRLTLGLAFGLGHFLPSLHWLAEVSIAAWLPLAVACALFPLSWYWAFCAVWPSESAPADGRRAPRLGRCGTLLLLAALWVALEWVRSWILTGFPWNQLGISQWQSRQILRLATVTGVYGISYLVVATNLAAAAAAERWWVRFWRGQRVGVPREVILAGVLFVPVIWLVLRAPQLGEPTAHLRVVAVQGCMPQCRQWRQEQLDEAIEVYTSLSRQLAHTARPDLIVWPETAVPAPALWNDQYKAALAGLFRDVATSFLIGSVDYRPRRDKPDEPLCVNSALLFTPRGEVLDYYDKTHLVPVGEYTPLESLWPWLTDWIGMGRSLTPGAEFTVFNLPRGIRAGVNICFEDAFPAISRQFVLRGATLLFTLTNDAWYAESAGSRQHLTHAVLRAVENARPLLRSGNNSDTCLILPDGTVSGLLLDPQTGNRFLRAARAYDVPVWTDAPLTFYTRHGDVFAHACAVAAAAFVLALGHNWLSRKRDLWLKGSGQAAPSVPHAADSAGGGSTPTA